MPRKPTEKQAKAVAYLAQHPKATLSQAMREAGYSEVTIDKPGENFAGLEGVRSLADQLRIDVSTKVSSKRIANKISSLMDAQKPFSSLTEPDRMVDDNATQLKATELAIRVHTLFEEKGPTTNVQINLKTGADKYRGET